MDMVETERQGTVLFGTIIWAEVDEFASVLYIEPYAVTNDLSQKVGRFSEVVRIRWNNLSRNGFRKVTGS